MGRLVQQLAVLEGSHMPLVQRSYEYDLVGNLIQTQDKRFGTTNYRYDKLGQIQLAGQELFRFDPAHNIIERESERIQNNQVTAYQGITYRYDEFGNLSQRTLPNGEVQSYRYNAKDKLVEVTIQKPNQAIETWQYQYDVLGRRISKRLQNQYADEETGLHYNFFRYYEPNIGRFTQLDPIGLAGGENLYEFAPNAQKWIDVLGLARFCTRALNNVPFTTDIDKSFRGGLDLGIFHEHIFFDDGTNIGYTNTGLFSETSNKGYKCSNIHYDDKIMKEAVKNVKARTTKKYSSTKNKLIENNSLDFGGDNYNVFTNNCQDFATEVEKEYKRLEGAREK